MDLHSPTSQFFLRIHYGMLMVSHVKQNQKMTGGHTCRFLYVQIEEVFVGVDIVLYRDIMMIVELVKCRNH